MNAFAHIVFIMLSQNKHLIIIYTYYTSWGYGGKARKIALVSIFIEQQTIEADPK